jgi:hypothetical protein
MVANVPAISEEPTVEQDRETEEQSNTAHLPTTEYPRPTSSKSVSGVVKGKTVVGEAQTQSRQVSSSRKEESGGEKFSLNWRVLLGVVTLFTLLVLFLGGSWLRRPTRGPRELNRVISNEPLYDGKSLTGWRVDGSMDGAWNTVEAPDSSEAIACTDSSGAITRRLPKAEFFRVSLFVWVQDDGGAVDIDFANDFVLPADLRGTLRLESDEAILGTKNGDYDELSVYNRAPLPERFSERYHVVYIERQKADWYVFLEQGLIGTIPISHLPESGAIRVVVHGNDLEDASESARGQDVVPRVFFSDFQLSKLAEETIPNEPE